MTARPDLQRTLSRLKNFQRQSVEFVFRRLFTDSDRVDRFLLADEVGLGKTLVARGVTASMVDHLWERAARINVVYICSNGDVARQNIKRLRIDGQEDFAFASRLTLLPLHTKDLASRKLNFVSFTPATSFELGKRSGIVEERALLYCLLEERWAFQGVGPKNVLQGGASTDRWRQYLDWFRAERRSSIDPGLARAFIDELEHTRDLRERFSELCVRFQRARERVPDEDRKLQGNLLGELRRILARCCIRMLEPDLIILDEFQRFRNLLHGDDDVSQLAQELFDYRGPHDKHARVLLLSATPYKMYTLIHESEEDHYRYFLETVRFLFRSDAHTAELKQELRHFRAALCESATPAAELVHLRAAIESRLRKVMCRTERLAVAPDRNGMLEEVRIPAAQFSAVDVRTFAWMDRLSQRVGAGDCVELWKSGAYLLNFMDDYEVKRKVVQLLERGEGDLEESLQSHAAALFKSDAVHRYEPIDAGNAKLRGLLAESLDRGGWKLLWTPPSLPYYAARGAFAEPTLAGFTKALIFSSWRLVPKVISAIGSYEAERRMVRSGDANIGYGELRERQRALLRFSQDEQRLTGMPLFTLLYPCVTLARAIDPLELGYRDAQEGGMADAQIVLSAASAAIRELMKPFVDTARRDGPLDERWYWAALLILDRECYPGVRSWLDANGEGSFRSMGGEEDSHYAHHVDHAARFLEQPEALGSPPADLFDVLAKVAVSSPAVVALRALSRRWPGSSYTQEHDSTHLPPLLSAAARIGTGFRALFNRPEVILLLRDLSKTQAYWESVLDYGVDGNLQSVMDEYVHVLGESMGLENAATDAAVELAERIHESVSLRATALTYDEFNFDGGGGVSLSKQRLRCRYALRFGDGDPDDGTEVTREDQVRSAFNSPFRPFILASTSVGQEGLDFHLYCRAVYHWNLPSNPVDLEQREGRVHRYKGHVIRQNLASHYGLTATAGAGDPWKTLFDRAAADGSPDQVDLVPYWIFPGKWKIERRVPLFPLSRETTRLEDLKASLALYRLVFGQPGQEELLSLLRKRFVSEDDLLRCRIDLSPRAGSAQGCRTDPSMETSE